MTTVETIRAAGTMEEVKAVLLGIAKVSDMAGVYEAVTGYSYGGQLRGINREVLATHMASQMMTMRENGRFKTMSAEEKYEEMKKLSELPKELALSTLSELEAIAVMVGIDEAAYADKSEYEKKHELESQIASKLKAKKLEELKTAESVEDGLEKLKECDTSILAELAKNVGSDFWERMAEAREEYSDKELVEWAKRWILERLGAGASTAPADDEEAETEMEAVAENSMDAEETEELTACVKPEIAFPLEGHTAESLKNLVNTIYSRGSLMSKATGGDFRVF